MRRISVCHILTDLAPAGTERSVYELARRLDRNRFDVHVVGLRGGAVAGWLSDAGISVDVLGVRGKLDVLKLGRLIRILRDRRPDVVHTHLFHADLAGRIAARLAGVKHVVHSVRAVESRFRPWQFAWAKLTADACSCTICISEAVREHYLRRTGLPAEKVRVIPNGIDPTAWYRDTELGSRIRRQRAIPDDAVVAAFVGRLHADKGIDVLAAAMNALGDRGPWLLIAGDGPMRDVVRHFVRGSCRADWLGHVEDVHGLLSAADLLIMPSRTEGMPVASLEAMAAGLPVVASRAGGLAEVVADGETGLLVPPEDPAALSEAIMKLTRDADLRQLYGAASRRRAAEHFNIAATVAAHEQLYAEIL